jgi:hypothetical protein
MSMFGEGAEEKEEHRWLRHLLYTILTNQALQEKNIMAAIDTLNANVAKLKADVEALLAKQTGPTEAQVQAAADAVAAIDAEIPTTPAV